MFRDTYKAANDDIKPDSALLAQTLSRIEKGKTHPSLTFKTACTCALALLIAAGSIFGYVRYMDYSNLNASSKVVRVDTNNKTEDISDMQRSDLSNTSTTKDSSGDLEQEKYSYSKTSQSNRKNIDETQKTQEQSSLQTASAQGDISGKSTESADTDEILAQTQDKNTAQDTENSIEKTSCADESDNSSISSGGGGSSAAQSTKPHTISYSSYCQYIGTDIFKKLDVPHDMSSNTWSEAAFDINNDEITFSYIGNGKSAYITPTKNTGKIYDLIQACPSNEKRKNHVSVYEKDYSYAYIVSGDVGYTVNCYGFDMSEFTQLTDSILK